MEIAQQTSKSAEKTIQFDNFLPKQSSHDIQRIVTESIAYIDTHVAKTPVKFFIDSGAQVNTIIKKDFERILANTDGRDNILALEYSTDKRLKAYASDNEIKVIANFSAELVISEDRPVSIEKFYVVDEIRSLLGFNTALRYSVLEVGLDVAVNALRANSSWKCELDNDLCCHVLDQQKEFPKFNITPVSLRYDKTMPPSRNVYTHIPAVYKDLTKKKLNDLLCAGIIEKVTTDMDRSFCSSLLVVPKGKHDIRLVTDLRGPNRCIYRTPFKMPTFESILLELHGAQWFSTIDLSSAFFHVELNEDSRHLTNFFAGDQIYRYRRLPFGLCNAPDIFQEALQTIVLAGCKGTVNYLDDIMVSGRTKAEHDENLAKVMACLKNHNVKINEEKCVFGKQSVNFIGHTVSSKGWMISDDKIAAIRGFRNPETICEVKSFLGLINFVDRFIHNRADKTQRLRELAKSDHFYWNKDLADEFEYLKNDALNVITKLGYFNKDDKTEIYVDASPYGLGAVLVQFDEHSVPRVIGCASKALSETEQRYPQTQREALAMVWGIERFSMYLMSLNFTVRTDAESNEYIFGGLHRIGKRAVSRAEAWALRLQPYQFDVERVPGKTNVADALSRLVEKSQTAESFDDTNEKHLLFLLDSGMLEISLNDIESHAQDNEEIIRVKSSIETGFWETDLRRFECQSKELHVFGSLVYRNEQIVLPDTLRQKAIDAAHQGHVGVGSTKRILRDYFWWPRLSKDVEARLKQCETCLRLSKKNRPIPLSSRSLPSGPWEILQIDFFTDKSFGTGEFLVIVDTYSRYLHVIEMKCMDAETTNAALNKVFLNWGYPLIIQSDNGPPFQSSKFVKIWEDKGIKIRKSIPLSPQTNGAVERQNEGIKKALAAAKLDNVNWRQALDNYVHVHNKVRPLSRLGVTPFELLVGRKFRGTFPCMWSGASETLDRQDISEKDAMSKLISKQYADSKRGAKSSDLIVGDRVFLTQLKRYKSDPNFGSERFTIVARDGAKIVVRSDRGILFARNVADAKRIEDIMDGTNVDDDSRLENNTAFGK